MSMMEFALPFVYKYVKSEEYAAKSDRGSGLSAEALCAGIAGCESVSSDSQRNYEDANVICLRLSKMVTATERRAENPIHCRRCGAVLNHLSTVMATADGRNVWHCEFCSHVNNVHSSITSMPPSDVVTYQLSSFSKTNEALEAQLPTQRDETAVVFCIDTSGSMGQLVEMTEPVSVEDENGRLRLDRIVTRLQAVQAAIVSQLRTMALEYPDRRAAVVAFDDNVTYLGDGSAASRIVFPKHSLQSMESLLSAVSDVPPPGPVSTTFRELSSAVHKLQEGGFTALRAAAIISIALAGRWPGSKVVLCCDGPENMGVAGDGIRSKDTRLFYDQLGDYAAKHGVSVSIVVIDSAPCELATFSNLALRTNGKIIKESITTLSGQLGELIRDDVLAIHAGATFVTSPDIYVQNFNGFDATHTAFPLGIVKTSSDRTIKLGIRKDTVLWNSVTDLARHPIKTVMRVMESKASGRSYGLLRADVNKETVKDLHTVYLQARVDFTDLRGMQCLSVFTVKIPIVSDPNPCLEGVRRPVIGLHGAHMAARLVYQHQFDEARRVLEDLKRTLLTLGSPEAEINRCTCELAFICRQAQDENLNNDDAVAMAIRKLTDGLEVFTA